MHLTTSDPVLRAVELQVAYDDLEALAPSTFTVNTGELIAVVGPNGAGKSTLFKALAGFIDHRGDVVIHGETCHHLERQAIAYIPQQTEVDLRFPATVADVVMSGRRRFHKGRFRIDEADRTKVASCLFDVDLVGMEDRSLATLSGGQVQRVLLARALAQEADVLLLDEALSGVDVRHVDDLIALFHELCARGTSILVSTHDLGLVRSRFERCIAINGRIVGDGSPARELADDHLEELFIRNDNSGGQR